MKLFYFLLIHLNIILILSNNSNNKNNFNKHNHNSVRNNNNNNNSKNSNSNNKNNKNKQLKFCSISNIFQGSWVYGPLYKVPDNVYEKCPLLLHKISDTTLKDQPQKWSCHNRSYYQAVYSNPYCSIKSIDQSFQELEGKHLTFVGDSLMGELYISMSCLAEKLGFQNKIRFNFIHELFLRPDFPCNPRCLTNSTYLEEQLNIGLFNSCLQCKEGIQKKFDDSYEWNPKYWPTKIRSSNTTAVIMGIGAWYNYYHQLISPKDTYAYTLVRNIPILRNLLNSGVKIYWIDLPPMPPCDKRYCTYYGWESFDEFNRLARNIFDSIGITFLNTSQITSKRKFYDLQIVNSDLFHWCNPGEFTIPEFFGQIYFHLLTESLKNQ